MSEGVSRGHRIGPPLSRTLSRTHSDIYFYILHSYESLFGIDHITGQIFLQKPDRLNFESEINTYDLTIIIKQAGAIGKLDVNITVDDVIDEPPVFSQPQYTVTVPSKSLKSARVLHLDVTDSDRSDRHMLDIISVEPAISRRIFSLDQTSMSLFIDSSSGLNESMYTVRIRASDLAGLTDDTTVLVKVKHSKLIETFDQKIVITENLIPDSPVFTIDSDRYSSCSSLSEHQYLKVSFQKSWDVWLTDILDYEAQLMVNTTIACRDSSEQIIALYNYQIVVMDENDNPPVFPTQHIQYIFPENLRPGALKIPLEAIDADSGEYGEVNRYYLHPPVPEFVVTYDSQLKQHYITNSHSLDYEKKTEHLLTVFAQDGGGLVTETPLTIQLSVTDLNDNSPVFEKDLFTANISPMYSGPVFQVHASDEDSVSSSLQYELHSPFNFITIDQTTGLVSISSHSNCQVHTSLYIGYVLARDENGRTSIPSQFEIRVDLESDSSTNCSSHSKYHFQVAENIPIGTIFGRVICEECVSYSSLTQFVPFGIFSESGELYTTDLIDYEADPITYNFTVLGMDADGQQFKLHASIVILDANDHTPQFIPPLSTSLQLNASIPEGTVLLSFTVEDSDLGSPLGDIESLLVLPSIPLSVLPFIVEEETKGKFRVKTASSLSEDWLKQLSYIDVAASDGGGLSSEPLRISIDTTFEEHPLSASHSRFARQAVNETGSGDLLLPMPTTVELSLQYRAKTGTFYPINTQNRRFTVIVPENSNPGEFDIQISPIAEELVDCPQEFANIELVLNELNIPFRVRKSIDLCSFSILNTVTLDFESDNQTVYYLFTVQALFEGVPVSEAIIEVFVLDVNEFAPVFRSSSYSAIFPENYIGFILQVQATDSDGSLEYSRIQYSVPDDDRFEVLTDGSVQSVVSFDYEIADPCIYFNVTATDAGGLNSSAEVKACLEDVNDNCPDFDQSEYRVDVTENILTDSALFNLTAIDYDSSAEYSSVVVFGIESNDTFTTGIVRLQGNQLFLRRPLDYETDPTKISVVVSASDAADNKCTAAVVINVINVNDVPLRFTIEYQQIYIREETFPYQLPDLPENILACFEARDPEGENVTYFLPRPVPPFELTSLYEGCVRMTGVLDYERERRHEIEISATDGFFNASTFLVVDVENQNDLALKIKSTYEIEVVEAFYTTDSILTITVDNPTPGTNYLFSLEETSEMFHVTIQGRVHLRAELDYESQRRHSFTVSVGDGTNVAIVTVNVNVLPANELPPVFLRGRATERLMPENTPPGLFEFTLSAIDRDRDSTYGILYEIEYVSVDGVAIEDYGEAVKLPFTIIQPGEGGTDGTLINMESLDYESDPREYVMAVYANDTVFRSEQPLSLTVIVEDVNDHPPQFEQDLYNFTFPEDQDNFEVEIPVTDGDGSPQFSLVSSFRLIPIFPTHVAIPFFVSSGVIRNIRRFDYERPPNLYSFMFVASDDYGLSGSTNVTITILDSNEFAPIFDSVLYQAFVEETIPVGSEILRVHATDRDGGEYFSRIHYSMESSGTPLIYLPFELNSTSGSITLKSPVDFDEGDEGGDFFVRAEDAGGMSSLTRVFVSFQDVNDNAPCPLVRTFRTQISENIFYDRPLRRIQVFDIDYYADNPRPIFYMEPVYSAFQIDAAGRLYLTRMLDYEEQSVYNFQIISSDGFQNCSTTTSVEIGVLNLDDNRPEFSPLEYQYNISEALEPGVIFNISAFDADPPDYIQEYRLVSDIFELPFSVSNDGMVSTTTRFNADDPSQQLVYSFEALAYNQYGQDTQPPAQITVSILDVNDHPPVFIENSFVAFVSEHSVPGFESVLTVEATDDDRTSEFSTLSYELVSESSYISSIFSISSLTGQISLDSVLDYETASQLIFTFDVVVTDGLHTTATNVTVFLTDVNEFPPEFSSATYNIVIPIDIEQGAAVYTFVATDNDGSEQFQSVSRYVLIRDDSPISGRFPFELDTNGTLYTVINSVEYQESEYTFRVMAYDNGNLTSSLVNVSITFKDFALSQIQTEYCLQFTENYIPLSPIFDFASFERNNNSLYTYQLNRENTSVNLDLSGTELRLTKPLDFEGSYHYLAQVIVTNRLGDTVLISVSVCAQNINDNPTEFVDSVSHIVLSDDSGEGEQAFLELSDRDSNWGLLNDLHLSAGNTCCDRK